MGTFTQASRWGLGLKTRGREKIGPKFQLWRNTDVGSSADGHLQAVSLGKLLNTLNISLLFWKRGDNSTSTLRLPSSISKITHGMYLAH